MPTVRDILADKGSDVHSIGPEATVLSAAEKMNQHKIGALVVLDAGRVIGMFTERDVLRRVVGQHRDPGHTRVDEVMTVEVVACQPDTGLQDVEQLMMERRIRHMPAVDAGGGLVGVISIGDLNAWRVENQERTIGALKDYIYGNT